MGLTERAHAPSELGPLELGANRRCAALSRRVQRLKGARLSAMLGFICPRVSAHLGTSKGGLFVKTCADSVLSSRERTNVPMGGI